MMLDLSRISLGTMRFADKGLLVKDVVDLLNAAKNKGVNCLHLSHEYSSFDLLSKALNLISSRTDFKAIVKVSSPHFSEKHFDRSKLIERIDFVLASTKLERIDVAQWMWRMNPLDDDLRVTFMREMQDEIKYTFDSLITEGKVGAFGCFPYSEKFMQEACSLGLVDCEINYCNFFENAFAQQQLKTNAIVLRPYAAGRIFNLSIEQEEALSSLNNEQLYKPSQHALAYLLSNENVATVVAGVNSLEQLDDIADIQHMSLSRYSSYYSEFVKGLKAS